MTSSYSKGSNPRSTLAVTRVYAQYSHQPLTDTASERPTLHRAFHQLGRVRGVRRIRAPDHHRLPPARIPGASPRLPAPPPADTPQATVSFAESLLLPIDMRFTDPAAPLFLEVDGDLADTLFVLSTSQVHDTDAPLARAESVQPRGRKRELEPAEPPPPAAAPGSARKKPMKVVARGARESAAPGSMPPPSLPHASNPFAPSPSPPPPREPLFFPGSQLSQADAAALRASGLGIERMNAEELAALMEDEGEEVDVRPSQAASGEGGDVEMGGDRGEEEEEEERDELDDDEVMRESSLDLYDDGETQIGPTQGDTSSKASFYMLWTPHAVADGIFIIQVFRPLFDD